MTNLLWVLVKNKSFGPIRCDKKLLPFFSFVLLPAGKSKQLKGSKSHSHFRSTHIILVFLNNWFKKENYTIHNIYVRKGFFSFWLKKGLLIIKTRKFKGFSIF